MNKTMIMGVIAVVMLGIGGYSFMQKTETDEGNINTNTAAVEAVNTNTATDTAGVTDEADSVEEAGDTVNLLRCESGTFVDDGSVTLSTEDYANEDQTEFTHPTTGTYYVSDPEGSGAFVPEGIDCFTPTGL